MNVVNVERSDTFEDWRLKTNEIGAALGDVDSLGGETVAGEINQLQEDVILYSIVFS